MKYYCIKQHDITDCGAACLAIISKQYGLSTSITKIREVAGTDKQGTNAYGMVKAAEQLGFTAKAVKGNKEAFFSEFPLPCIAHVVVGGTLLHYVVIHKITKKEVTIADPAKGIGKKSPEMFSVDGGDKARQEMVAAHRASGQGLGSTKQAVGAQATVTGWAIALVGVAAAIPSP